MPEYPNAFAPNSAGPLLSPPGLFRNDPGGLPYSTDANGTLLPAQSDSAGNLRITGEGGKLTYSAVSQFACDSTATDIAFVAGSTSCVAKILKIIITSAATAAAGGYLTLIRRSAANTAGTPVAASVNQFNIASAAPNLAPKHYTAHPTSLGTSAGDVWGEQYGQTVIAGVPSRVVWDFTPMFGQQGLRLAASATDILAINAVAALGGSGNQWSITWIWTEEPITA